MKSVFTSIFLLSLVAGSLAAPQPRGHKKPKGSKGTPAAPAPAAPAPAAPSAAPSAQSNAATPVSPNDPLAPAPVTDGSAGPATVQISQSITDAAANWAKNTAVVSNFLNQAPFLKGQDFIQQAQIALNAEINELVHKGTLDADPTITSRQDVQSANATLVGAGAFQKVVDLLRVMSQQGDSVGLTDADSINTNRCKNVLPNIDIYLAAAGTNFKSTRPFNCGPTSVQVLGPPQGLHDVGGVNAPASGNSNTAAAAPPTGNSDSTTTTAAAPPPAGGPGAPPPAPVAQYATGGRY